MIWTLVAIGTAAWLLAVLFALCLGRMAKLGDEQAERANDPRPFDREWD